LKGEKMGDAHQEEAARTRAYQIWESSGRPDRQHESHWHQALKELGLVSPVDGQKDVTPIERELDSEDAERAS
jgi:hypothetical protein